MKREVTIQEALTELAAAKIKLESMQQLLILKEHLLSSKDEQINFQIFTIKEKDEEIKKLKEEGKRNCQMLWMKNPEICLGCNL